MHLMFKVPESCGSEDLCARAIVDTLNKECSNFIELEVNFWIVWLESYFGEPSNAFCVNMSRKVDKASVKEELIQEVNNILGIKNAPKKKKQELSKDEVLGKMVRNNREKVEDVLKYEQRVMCKVEKFESERQCIVWALKIGRNRFSTDVVARYVELHNIKSSGVIGEKALLVWFVGRMNDTEVLLNLGTTIRASGAVSCHLRQYVTATK